MFSLKIVLLPGLDGTSLLFDSLLRYLPPYLKPFPMSYPTKTCMDFSRLRDYTLEKIDFSNTFVLLAESFSGPVALEIAATKPKNLIALILVATFVENPLIHLGSWTRYLAYVPWFELPIPSKLIRKYLLGKDISNDQTKMVRSVLRLVKPHVLNHRLHLVLNVNVKEALSKCPVPMLYLSARKDRLITRRSVDAILNLRPDVECVTIDAPHMLLQASPMLASKVIDRFLQKVMKQ